LKRAALFVWSCALALGTLAQGPIQPETPDTLDWQAWGSLSLDWKPFAGLKVALQEQWRVKENGAAIDRQFHQLSVGWSPQGSRFAKAHTFGLGGRVVSRFDNQGSSQGWDRFFRWHGDYEATAHPGRWTLIGRIRHQRRTALWLKGGGDIAEVSAKKTWRVKFTLAYNIKKWKLDPIASVERLVPETPEGWPSDGAWRVRLGTDIKPGKRQKLKLILQREWRGRYLPSGVGATLDDFRLYGDNEWAIIVGYRYRMKTGKKKG
jgi:hypothetical protein